MSERWLGRLGYRFSNTLHQAPNGFLQAVLLDRLQQIVAGVQIEGLDRVFPVGGHEHDLGPGRERLDLLGQLDAGDFRHFDVQEDDIRLQFFYPRQRLMRIGVCRDQRHFRSLVEEPFEIIQAESFVVYYDRAHLSFTPLLMSVLRFLIWSCCWLLFL